MTPNCSRCEWSGFDRPVEELTTEYLFTLGPCGPSETPGVPPGVPPGAIPLVAGGEAAVCDAVWVVAAIMLVGFAMVSTLVLAVLGEL